MIGHDDIGSEIVVIHFGTTTEGGYDYGGDGFLRQIHRPLPRSVQITIHPYEGSTRGEFIGRWVSGVRKAAVKMPRCEKPFALWMLVRKPPVKVWHIR